MIKIDFKKVLAKMPMPKIYSSSGHKCYLDPFRQKLIIKTPEEKVRQAILQYLVIDKKIPEEMIKVEWPLSKYGVKSRRRADIIIERFDKKRI